jgi:hypothetical protein
MQNLGTNGWIELNQSHGTLESRLDHFGPLRQDAESATGITAPEIPNSGWNEAER